MRIPLDQRWIEVTALGPAISRQSVTLAELAAGPHATSDPVERAGRQVRLQRSEVTFDSVPWMSFSVSAEPPPA